jgi:hypothetical protein
MAHAVARWVPFVLLALACGVFLIAPDVNGPLLIAAWLVVFGIERAVAASIATRDARVALDAILLIGCVLAAFEGGWYLVPSAIAFLWIDRRPTSPTGTPINRVDRETVAGLGAGAAGLAGLVAVLLAPLWTSATSTIGTGGVLDAVAQPSNLLAVGLLPRTAIFFVAAALLSGVIAGSALAHARRGGRTPSRILGLSVIGLGAVAVLGAFTVGLFLLPAVGLGAWAWLSGRTAPDRARHS